MTSDPSGEDLAVSAAELQALLLSTAGIEDFLQKMADLAAGRVTDGLSCGITLRPNGRPLTVASSDELAAAVDEVQYGIDKGPCLHAMRTGELVSVPDTAGEPRWAGFEARAAAHGSGRRCRSRSSPTTGRSARSTSTRRRRRRSGRLSCGGPRASRRPRRAPWPWRCARPSRPT
ncbi:MAG TPA: GAF domain-containing protein [Streptosporangiaceae bacterium]|nr:GAF domain-containing protein [Streptosporangiaceae bacterium]